jgi:hypothetical protein
VAQQEAEDKETRVAVLKAEVEAAKARVDLLEAPARADEVLMAKARIQAAKANLGSATVRLQRAELRAPSTGQILEINLETGELTGPDVPEPAIILVDTSKLHVRAFVEEMDAPRVNVGMAATITADGLSDRQLNGRVARLSPRMSRKELWSDQPAERYDTKTREVWIELEPAEDLVVGLRVDAVIDPESCNPPNIVDPDSPDAEPGSTPETELGPLAQSPSNRP